MKHRNWLKLFVVGALLLALGSSASGQGPGAQGGPGVQAALGTSATGADVNGDGVVDNLDLAAVERQWGQAGSGWTDVSPCQALIGSAAATQPGPASGGIADSPADQVPSLTLIPGNGDYQVGEEVDLEVHLDTDEGNACDLVGAGGVELLG